MKALSHFARFQGRYKEWKEIIENHGLKWRTKQVFNPLTRTNITQMIQYLKEIRAILPNDIWNTFVFDTLTGLRAGECLNAIRLIQEGAQGYYNEESQVIEHHKFPELFIRNSKNAFISIVDKEMLETAKHACAQYYRIRMFLRSQNKAMLMKYCRKIFATYLRQNGIVKEDIDILQGRSSQGIFETHYYSPNMNELIAKVKPILCSLRKEVEG